MATHMTNAQRASSINEINAEKYDADHVDHHEETLKAPVDERVQLTEADVSSFDSLHFVSGHMLIDRTDGSAARPIVEFSLFSCGSTSCKSSTK